MKFYSNEEVQTITNELNAGTKVTEITRKYFKEWGRSYDSLMYKVCEINKKLKQGRPVTKRGRPVGSKTKVATNNGGIVLSSGFIFDFKPQRAEMHADHVRLYF